MNEIGEHKTNAEVAVPQVDVMDMTDTDFEKYLDGAREAGILSEQSELSSTAVTLESERSESDKRNFKTATQESTVQGSEGVTEGISTDREEGGAKSNTGAQVFDEAGTDGLADHQRSEKGSRKADKLFGKKEQPRRGKLPNDVGEEAESGGGWDAPFKVYQSQEEYQKEFDARFEKRFKDYKQTEKVAGTFNELLPVFADLYGTEDIEVIKKMIADDHARVMAERSGVSEDEFKQSYNERVQSDRERRELAQLKEQLAAQQQVNGWRAEAIEVSRSHPGFDLDRQYAENSTFKEYLFRGLSVSDAYLLSNKDEILKKPKVNPAKHSRIPEGNVVPAGTSAPLAVDEMTEEQFEKYLESFRA